MITIDTIKRHKNSGNIYITQHSDQRMRERNICNQDIYNCIDNGETFFSMKTLDSVDEIINKKIKANNKINLFSFDQAA